MIRTVLGDIAANELLSTDYHEHLFQVSPLLRGDELDDEQASSQEAALLRRSGFDSMVDATPTGLGRDPGALARIAAGTGLTIVATTGAHRTEHYENGHWILDLSPDELARRFIADIETGMPESDGGGGAAALNPDGQPVRAGVVKAGIGYWSISGFEHRVLEAVGASHRETGSPVMVHLEFCTAAHEVLDLLEATGVDPGRVVLAHADRDIDPVLHLELAARGAYLGYDGVARARTRSEAELVDLTRDVVAGGGGDRVLLGGDVARRTRYVAYGGMPGLAYLGDRHVPRLRRELGDGVVNAMLVTNPARWLDRDVG